MFDFRLYLICTIEINVDSSLYVHQSVYLMGEAAESNKECILSQVCLTVIVIIIILNQSVLAPTILLQPEFYQFKGRGWILKQALFVRNCKTYIVSKFACLSS